MSNKKKTIIIFLVSFYGACAIMFAIAGTAFYYIRHNPIDNIAMPYLWNTVEISEQYGEIQHISRYHTLKEKRVKTDTGAQIPYAIETVSYEIIVRVTLIKTEDSWQVESYEIRKVRDLGKN